MPALKFKVPDLHLGYPLYTREQVSIAAAAAYCSCVSGDDDNYVISKAERFVERCMKLERASREDGMISKQTIDEVAFAALDIDCEKVLNLCLDMFSKQESSVKDDSMVQRFSGKCLAEGV